ncbi:MAG: outer membrane protein [Xanthobacteraceae bacterium]|jgi:opacity protein-like surface antigen
MVSVRLLCTAASAIVISTAAYAADMPQMPPPQPQYAYQPPLMIMQQPEGAWYLRGDIGIGIETETNVEFLQNSLNSSDFSISHTSIGDSTFFLGGIGYEFNNWLRFDVTGEYRSKAPVNFFGTYTQAGGVFGDQYQGFLQSAIFLANAYVDLGTWNCLTPFVGVGIGGAWNKFADLTDTSIATFAGGAGTGIGRDSTNVSFAWALHAGLAYNVTKNFTVELAYRYLNYGSVTDAIDCAGGCNADSYKLQNLSSNDFMLGMRWRFPIDIGPTLVAAQPAPLMLQPAPQPAPIYQPPPPVYAPPPPVYTQPAPVYTQPAPVYAPQPQYPLSTRG